MKSFAQLLKLSGIAMLCALLLINCKKSIDKEEELPNEPGVSSTAELTVEQLNKISEQLRFFKAIKKDGRPPAAPVGSLLQVNIKDTLYLVPGLHMPVKFLHTAGTKNVKGAFVQVRNAKGKEGESSFYYDVQELAEMADNDEISVLGIDFAVPNNAGTGSTTAIPGFEIIVTPYDESGTPIVTTSAPVVVRDLSDNKDFNTDGGACSIVTEGADVWDWEITMTPSAPGAATANSFFAEPTKKIARGQDILGCCTNGFSDYLPGCKLPLRFNTFYQRMGESLTFLKNGTFQRQTFENVANPAPDESDWCSKSAVVHEKIIHVVSSGTWNINQQVAPAKLKIYYDIGYRLVIRTTTSNGTGFSNNGGFIHVLDCNTLILIEPDPEGFGEPTFKIYGRRDSSDPEWYPTK